MKLRRWIKRGVLAVGGWYLLAALLPFPHGKLAVPPLNTRYLDGEGSLLRRQLSEQGEDQDWVPLAESGEWAGKAIIAVEDKRFYHHPGVDPLAVLRALKQNLLTGRVVSGASTISTQVIRLIEPRPRNLRTKVVEAFRATQLEMRYDKDYILEQYLNRAPFGGNRTGIATASRRYYGKEPAMLSSGEAALLMGLPQSPSRFSPDRFPEKAEHRRETVLRRMREEGMISRQPLLDTGARWKTPPLKAYHFTEWIRNRYRWESGTLRTTLDSGVQERAERIVADMKKREAYAGADACAVLLMDARSGKIRAWVSGWGGDGPVERQVDTVTRKRAPGSTLKPFVYGQAIEEGWLTPETRLADLPRQYRDYLPDNMDEKWSGDVSAGSALVQSLNLPALQITGRVGVNRFIGVLRSAGMELEGVQARDVGLGSVLGGGMEVSLLELVESYTVFAGAGTRVEAVGLAGEGPRMTPVFSEGTAYWISHMLSGPERDGFLYGNAGDVERPPLAFKTGTSHGQRDAWAIGWNGDSVLGVWVGRLDGASVSGLSGSSHAAPLLGALAKELLPAGDAWPTRPPSVIQWRGREVLRGITSLKEPEAVHSRPAILSPPPNSHLTLMDTGSMWVSLEVRAPAGEQVHWFLNGQWLGRYRVEEAQTVELSPGSHHLRAVFEDGRSDSRTVTILEWM